MCHCDESKDYPICCGRFIEGREYPQTPLELMRSRYSAHVLHKWDYIKNTMADDFEKPHRATLFIKLEILDAQETQVEFKAYYLQRNKLWVLHERSDFLTINEKWIYVSGTLFDEPSRTIALNATCPCDSGKKFKNCHGVQK